MKKHHGMRPQDIVILLKIFTLRKQEDWNFAYVAKSLAISPAEVSESLNRSRFAKLVDYSKRHIAVESLFEFLAHGMRYVFPVAPAQLVRGVPTAHAAPPLSSHIVSQQELYVWENPYGDARGQFIEPLYPTVPFIALQNPELYQLLALVDALRVGRTREKTLAINLLEELLYAE